jgi:MFS family permease
MSFGAMVITWYRLPESRVHRPADASSWLHPGRFVPIFRHARLRQLILITFISMAGFAMLESIMAYFLAEPKTFHYGDWQVALYYVYIGLIILIVQGGFIGRLTKRFGEWPLAVVGPFLVAIGMLILAVVGFEPFLLLLLVGGGINAIGRSLQTPPLFALISRNSDPKEQGLVFGLNQGLGSIARVIGPVMAYSIYYWRISAPFVLAAAILLIAGFWTIALRASARNDAAPFPLPPESVAAESL